MVPILAALHSYTLHSYTSPGPNLPFLLAVILNHHHLPILENYLPPLPARKSWLTDIDFPSILPLPIIFSLFRPTFTFFFPGLEEEVSWSLHLCLLPHSPLFPLELCSMSFSRTLPNVQLCFLPLLSLYTCKHIACKIKRKFLKALSRLTMHPLSALYLTIPHCNPYSAFYPIAMGSACSCFSHLCPFVF